MSPEVLHKKLASMSTYLNDLLPFKDIPFETFMERHYEIERIIELLIMTASDIIFHLLSAQGEPAPSSYRTAFLRAGEIGIISKDLSKGLALGVGLRNILVHSPLLPTREDMKPNCYPFLPYLDYPSGLPGFFPCKAILTFKF